jgi:hypothetical protein
MFIAKNPMRVLNKQYTRAVASIRIARERSFLVHFAFVLDPHKKT